VKTDVLNLVAGLTSGLADQVSASNFYDETVYGLGDKPWLTTFTLIAATSQMHEFDLPATTVSLRGVVYDTRWLTESTLRSIEQYQRAWRYIGGREPFTYVLQDSPKLTVEVFPNTPTAGTAFTPPGVFTIAYPSRNFVAFTTEYRSTLPLWLETAVAFATISREYGRSSDHFDPDAQAATGKLADLLYACVA